MKQKEYKIVSNEVDKQVADIIEEFTEAINITGNNERLVRIRLLVAFSLAEVMCGIFDKFYNLKLENRLLMKKWFKEYCLTDKNGIYKDHGYIRRIDEDYLYKLRCSIVHAFALPEQKGKNVTIILNGVETGQDMKECDSRFVDAGMIPVFISTDSLTLLILMGAINLSKDIFVSVDALTDDQFEGMRRVYGEICRRGVSSFSLE